VTSSTGPIADSISTKFFIHHLDVLEYFHNISVITLVIC
jgi:hypothetical protein